MPIFNQTPASKSAISLDDDPGIWSALNKTEDEYVSADNALEYSDIYSLLSQLSGDLVLVKYKANKSRAQSLIDNPTGTTNGAAFWQSMFMQLLLDGNAYAYRWRNINGVDLRWEFLRPSQVQPYLLSDGSGMYYNVSFDEPEIGTKMYIPQSDMIHIRLASKNGGLTGVSPLKSLKPETQLKSASNKMALRALKQSVMVNGVLKIKHGGLLDWATRASHSRKAKAQIDNSNGGPFVIDDLEDYQPLEVKSNIANLLKQVDWTGSQIAKVYGVPDSFINGQGDQQSSIAQISNQYVKALNRYVTPIVSELNNKLNIHIDKDLRPAIDALGDNFATTISSLKKDGTLAGNQARYVLQKSGFLPDDLPQPDLTAEMTAKGGDDNGNTGSQGNNRA